MAASAAAAFAQKRPSKEYTIEQFLATTAIQGASFSADGRKLLFSSDASGIRNVQSIPVAGGEPSALTRSTTDTTTAVSWFPDDDRFLFTRDQGGNELNHLYAQTPAGEEKDLTPGEKLKAAFVKWTRDGAAFYVRSNERDARYFDVYRYDTKTYARTPFYQDDAGYSLGDVSEDGKWIAFQKINTTADSDIFLWNTAAKTMTPISKHEGTATYDPAAFDPRLEVALLPDQRRLRVRARPAVRAGERKVGGRREGRLGRRVDLLLEERQVPPLVGQRGRTQLAEGLGREDRRRRSDAAAPGG
jgi:hypothetical protein